MKSEIKSFSHAINGIKYAISCEKHLRFHLFAAVLVIAAGWFFTISFTEWCLVILSMGAVITAELINTALEQLVNLVSPQQHPIAGRVKDVAAGAVLVISMVAAIVGLMVFIPKVMLFINQ